MESACNNKIMHPWDRIISFSRQNEQFQCVYIGLHREGYDLILGDVSGKYEIYKI